MALPKHISEQDFSKLFLPVHNVEAKADLMKEFPIVGTKEEFRNARSLMLDMNKVIRYISYLYSVNSPLVKIYKDNLEQRKEEASVLAGFTKREMNKVEALLYDMDGVVANMVIRFLIIQNNMSWMSLCANEEMFYDNQKLIMTPLSSEKEKDKMQSADLKKKLREENKSLITDIEDLYKKIFKDNEDVEAAFNEAETKQHFFTPEDVANRMDNLK